MIRIRTLGGLSVQGANKAPTGAATQPRRLAVLALVARAGERGMTREKVLALLWPDSEEEAARRALSQALYALRRDLECDELLLGVQELRLNPDTVTCDVAEFESALAARDLDRAAEAYAGPFLDGFRLPGAADFDRWVDDERRALSQRHADLLDRLAKRSLERGDATASVTWWRKLADLDPLNARVAAELMKAMVAAGDPGGALKHARIYEALLAQELDLEPDRQVIELAKRIRSSAAAPQSESSGARPAATPAVAAAAVAAAPAATLVAERPPVFTAAAAPATTVAAPPIVAPPVETPSFEPVPSAVATAPAATPPQVAPLAPAPNVSKRSRPRGMMAVAAVLALTLVAAAAWWNGVRARAPRNDPVLAVGRIVDYRASGGRDAEAMSDMLATNLARVKGLRVLSSARLYEVLAQLNDTNQPPNARLARAAQRAGATEVLEGGLHALSDGRLMLDLRRVDLATGALHSGYRLEGADVFALVSRATEDLSKSLDYPGAERLDPAEVSTRSLVAYRFYEEGLRSYSRADYRGAARLFEGAVAEDSTFAMAVFYRMMARTTIGAGQPDDNWDRVLRLAQRAPERERLFIRATWASGASPMEFEALADSLATLYPAEVEGPYMQGYARLLHADFQPAIGYMQRVLAMDSLGLRGKSAPCRACDAVVQLVYAYLAVDSAAAAERIAREYVRQQPEAARAWLVLASVLVPQERYDEATEAYRKAMSINPVNEYDRVYIPIMRLRKGDFEDADRLTRALMREGSTIDATEGHWTLTISLRYQARWRDALALTHDGLAALSPAARAGEHGRGLKQNEALIRFEAGQPRDAIVIWDSLTSKPPSDPAATGVLRLRLFQYTLLAGALAAAGDTVRLAAAADSVAKWAAVTRNRRDAHLSSHVRGLLLLARRDTAGAIGAFERAIFAPTAGFTRTNRELGALYVAQRRPADAVRVVGAALRSGTLENTSLYVTRTELHEVIARAFDALGNADSAAVHYRYVAAALERSDPGARPRYDAAVTRLNALGRAR